MALAATTSAATPRQAHALDLVDVGTFSQPVYVTGHGSRVYVVERRGRIRVLGRRRPLLDIRKDVLIRSPYETQDQRGLLSAAFASPTRFYVFFIDRKDRIRVDEFDRGRRRTLMTVPKAGPLHHGGQLQLGPDGLLYVSVGFTEDEDAPQDPLDPRGKILRFDPRAEQPFPTVFASGLRNPYRFSFHRDRLYVGDVGGDEAEEVTILDIGNPGGNLGWPVFEGRRRIAPGSIENHVAPRWVHRHDRGWCSIVGGYVRRGRYLYGDVCSGRVFASGRATRLNVPYLVSFGRDGRGRVYAVSFHGDVYRIVG